MMAVPPVIVSPFAASRLRTPANTVIPYAADTISVTAVAIDGQYAYAIQTGANGTLRRNTKDAKGTPELMLDGLATPNSLAVDANAIYIAVEGPPGAIIKTTKAPTANAAIVPHSMSLVKPP